MSFDILTNRHSEVEGRSRETSKVNQRMWGIERFGGGMVWSGIDGLTGMSRWGLLLGRGISTSAFGVTIS